MTRLAELQKKYAQPLPLDPVPWYVPGDVLARGSSCAYPDANRHCTFGPREGFEQRREMYP